MHRFNCNFLHQCVKRVTTILEFHCLLSPTSRQCEIHCMRSEFSWARYAKAVIVMFMSGTYGIFQLLITITANQRRTSTAILRPSQILKTQNIVTNLSVLNPLSRNGWNTNRFLLRMLVEFRSSLVDRRESYKSIESHLCKYAHNIYVIYNSGSSYHVILIGVIFIPSMIW